MGGDEDRLDPRDLDAFRRAIQRFTVRRTKTMLNELIDAEPEAFRNASGDMCRYPSMTQGSIRAMRTSGIAPSRARFKSARGDCEDWQICRRTSR